MFNLCTLRAVARMIVIALLLTAPTVVFAQTIAGPSPDDALSLLTFLGLGHYAASIIAVAGLIGYVLAHLIAWGWIPAPAAGATGAWPAIYAVLNWFVANYGKASNAAAPVARVLVCAVLGGSLLLVTGCAKLPPGAAATGAPNATVTKISATVNADLAKAQTAANMAVDLWGVAKGIAQIAGIKTATGDAIASTVQSALADAAADAPTIENLAQSLVTQANALTVQAAPLVKVVPGV